MSAQGTMPSPTTRDRTARSDAATRAVSDAWNGASGSEYEVLHVHVPDQVALDAQRLLVGFVVGERQVGLVVQDPYRRVVDLPHQPCRLSGGLGHGAEVVLDAEPYPGVDGFRCQRAQGRDQPIPVGGRSRWSGCHEPA